MIYFFQRNWVAAAALAVMGFIVSGWAMFDYLSFDAPDESTLIPYTGQVTEVEVTSRDNDPSGFSLRLSDSDETFHYAAFFPDFDTVLDLMKTYPLVTLWCNPDPNDEDPDIWRIELSDNETLVRYNQFYDARHKDSQTGLKVSIGMGVGSIFLLGYAIWKKANPTTES